MEMQKVESSQVEAIGYDAAAKKLAVQFKGFGGKPGPVYHYDNVPPELHQDFMAAPSKGRFLGEKIKPFTEKYPYRKQA